MPTDATYPVGPLFLRSMALTPNVMSGYQDFCAKSCFASAPRISAKSARSIGLPDNARTARCSASSASSPGMGGRDVAAANGAFRGRSNRAFKLPRAAFT